MKDYYYYACALDDYLNDSYKSLSLFYWDKISSGFLDADGYKKEVQDALKLINGVYECPISDSIGRYYIIVKEDNVWFGMGTSINDLHKVFVDDEIKIATGMSVKEYCETEEFWDLYMGKESYLIGGSAIKSESDCVFSLTIQNKDSFGVGS